MDSKNHKLLMVDNERGFLDPLKEFFEEKNYQVFLAKNGEDGIEALKNEGPFSVILSDQRMPKMMGVEFLKFCMKESPNTPRILVTAFQDSQVASEAINDAEIFAFVSKPVDLDDLNKLVWSAVKKYEAKLQTIRKHKILLLGEKVGLTNEIQKELLKRGYDFEFVRNGHEYMEVIKKNIPIAVVIFHDLNHKDEGLNALKDIKKHFPSSIKVLLTKPSNLAGIKDAINGTGVHAILTSPFDIHGLDKILKSSLQKYDQSLGESLVNYQKIP
jgi:DNA-binding NtrC family response regulator